MKSMCGIILGLCTLALVDVQDRSRIVHIREVDVREYSRIVHIASCSMSGMVRRRQGSWTSGIGAFPGSCDVHRDYTRRMLADQRDRATFMGIARVARGDCATFIGIVHVGLWSVTGIV